MFLKGVNSPVLGRHFQSLCYDIQKDNCTEFGPVDVFQFKSNSVKPISCIRIRVIIIIIIIIITTMIIIIIMIIIITIITNYSTYTLFFLHATILCWATALDQEI